MPELERKVKIDGHGDEPAHEITVTPRGMAYFVRWGSGSDAQTRELNDPDSVGRLVAELCKEGIDKIETSCIPKY